MNLHTSSFFNSTEVNISSRMNEYLKKNFGYEVEGDFDTLQEAKTSLQAEQLELKDQYMSAKYVENMLMIETITALLKAHGNTSIIKEDEVDEAYNPETGIDPNVDTTEWDELIANAKKKQGISDEEKVLHTDGHYSVVEVNPAEQATRATIVLRHWEKEISRGFYEPMDDAFVMTFDDNTTRMFETPEDLIKFMTVGSEKYYADRKEDTSEEVEEDAESVNEEDVTVDNAGNIAGYLDTIDEYVAMLFKGKELPLAHKNEVAYRIQAAVDDIRTRELGLKSSNVRSQYNEDEDDKGEEKGPEHYRYVNDSQLTRVQDRLRLTISELDHAIQYRAKNSHLFFNTGDKAGTGDLYRIKEKLEKIDDEWDDQTELYGM